MAKHNIDKMVAAARNNIARDGVHINWIADGKPTSFAYTVGMGSLDAPEFIIFNAKPEMIQWFLNNLAFRVRDGVQRFEPGTVVEGLLQGFDVYLMEVEDSSREAHPGQPVLPGPRPRSCGRHPGVPARTQPEVALGGGL